MDRYGQASDWSDEPPKLSERELLEWAATFSPRAEAELHRLQWAEATAKAESRQERELLEFMASFSEKHERELRALDRREAEERETRERQRRLAQDQTVHEVWDSSKHPRGAFSQNRGWWSPTGGSGSAGPTDRDSTASRSATWHSALMTDKLAARGGSDALAADATPPTFLAAANDAQGAGNAAAVSTDWYLPSDDKGTWLGNKRGEGTFRLRTPVEVNGELVSDIEFRKGVPNLDKFALPGETATIILTGDRDADIRHAKDAWKKINPDKKLPPNATFHHDLLNTTEHIEIVNGKKTKVLVGKMPLIPTDIHQPLYHQGSASAAARYYEGLGKDTMEAIKGLSKEQASLAGTGKDFVTRAARKIKSGKIAKGLLPFVGRTVLRAIPLAATGLAILEFADNVEAHGVGGAIARATPVLGDLIAAHDLGTDLAKQITDDANSKADAHLRSLNGSVDQAHEEANQQTLDAFRELASQIKVTNSPEYGSGRLVNPQEVTDALTEYRNAMMIANHLRIAGQKGFDYKAAATRNMENLKRALERASQKRAPSQHGPRA
jgi:hypothetical protein